MIVQHGGGVFAGWKGKGCPVHDSAFPELKILCEYTSICTVSSAGF